MSYIERNLLPDERILFFTKKHIIIFFFPMVWTIFSIYAAAYMQANFILDKLAWMPGLLAAFFWIYVGIEYVTSEFAVTNKRVMMREGFFYRHATELRLATISQVMVDQSLLGQMLNYGAVTINAFGAFDVFTLINKPLLFQKIVNEQLDKLTSSTR
ncbi:MAG: putative membrane-associated protein [uncultured bacterium]|nr:MAG: putative membrane-associated protein [uncultured bacterium]